MKDLKTKSLKKSLPLVILFTIVACVFLGLGIWGLTQMAGKENFDDLDFSGELEGKYVSGTAYFVYDYVCEETVDGKVVSRDYLIDAGDDHYMVLHAADDVMRKTNALMQVSQDYMDGIGGEDAVYEKQFPITGTIMRLTGERLTFYHDYVCWDELTAEEKDMCLPYVLEVDRVGNIGSGTSVYIFLVLGFVFLAAAAVFVILALSGRNQKMITDYLKSQGNSELVKSRVESFLSSMDPKKPLYYNEQFICGQNGAKTIFGEVDKLAWVYTKTITHKQNFITVGHSYYVELGFADGKIYDVLMKKEAEATAYVQDIAARFPKVVCGYTDELSKMFRKTLPEFLKLKYYAAEQVQQAESYMPE